MTILLSSIGVTLGVICTWLVVRLVNRRNKDDIEVRINLGFVLLVLILVITPAICIFASGVKKFCVAWPELLSWVT